MLFFDEADVLFVKRSEIQGSHDRYANIEVEHILQRLESLRGLAILSTNSKSELFSVFARRIHYIIRLPSPTGPEIVKRAGIKTERKRPNE